MQYDKEHFEALIVLMELRNRESKEAQKLITTLCEELEEQSIRIEALQKELDRLKAACLYQSVSPVLGLNYPTSKHVDINNKGKQ